MHMKNLLLPLAAAFLGVAGLHAAELGDPAKPLDIKEWVKGSPVDLAAGKGKTVYVVEFWATWCPPCRASIPHLTELQKKFKDKGVVFIGVSDEKSDVVKKFVEKMGDKMDYTVAIDGGKTAEGYMEAYGINGIPHAFIVDKAGKIAWHGHPMENLEDTLQDVIDGKYDMAKVKKQAEAQTKLQEYIQLSLSGEDPDKAKKLEAELTALDKELGGIVRGEKFDPADIKKRVQFSQTFMKYQQLVMRGGDADEIAKLEKEIEATAPKDFDLAKFKENLNQAAEKVKAAEKAKTLMDDYLSAVGEGGNPQKAAELAKKLDTVDTDNPQFLNEVAWTILTDDAVKTRDIKLALKLAKRAVDATDAKEGAILDTYARALFDDGQVTEAIAQQKKAVDLVDDDNTKSELKATLEKYEAKAKETAKPAAK
jgi:thiol-disulfide isomerase/thioredoxin